MQHALISAVFVRHIIQKFVLLGDGGWWLAVVRCAGPGGAAGHIKAAGNVMAGKHRIIIGQPAQKFCLDI